MLRSLHRWLGLLTGVLLVVAAGSAICLNHRALILGPPPPGAGLYSQYLKDLAVDPADPLRMVAGTDRALHLSTDGGRTWRECAALPSVEDVEFDAARPGVAYAAGRGGVVLETRDGGSAWAPSPLPFPPDEGVQVSGLAVGADGRLTLLTSRGVYRPAPSGWTLEPRPPQPEGHETARAVVRTLYDLHDGSFWGRWGVLVTDVTCVAILMLVVTGYRMGLRRRG